SLQGLYKAILYFYRSSASWLLWKATDDPIGHVNVAYIQSQGLTGPHSRIQDYRTIIRELRTWGMLIKLVNFFLSQKPWLGLWCFGFLNPNTGIVTQNTLVNGPIKNCLQCIELTND